MASKMGEYFDDLKLVKWWFWCGDPINAEGGVLSAPSLNEAA